ncbi:MAG: phosphoenolpyruvate carboxykinase (ATP) [Enterococcus sp.]|jgi:phosphoenolpyruvate carboxykinase (ATP)|nr:phosphoenolpyruvate carboxykinase (ATP) [Enterococcus sp.]
MSTIKNHARQTIKKNNPLFSSFKSLIETAFYGNQVTPVDTLTQAYTLAAKCPKTIVTDLPVYQAEMLGLPKEAKVLVSNDGEIVGRTSAARRIIGEPGIDEKYYEDLLREALYHSSTRDFYRGDAIVGLSEDFMVEAHLLLPAGFEANFYSYFLNFQIMNDHFRKRYRNSDTYHENDIYLYADPYWQHPDFPNGLAIFDPRQNVGAILGLRYLGELKKGTLTLAWAMAHRNGYIACHGGLKQYQLPDKKYTMAAFGLSGSGKSTITLAEHGHSSKVTVLHDDAFIIHDETGATTALEPAYFDKTQDYPMDSQNIQYIVTCQNVGVTLDENNLRVLVTEDIRNNNGRAVKSQFATPNRVNHIEERLDGVYWIMKDSSLPPIIRVDDPILAAVFGVTLATKRSTAENVPGGVDLTSLVIEPFANPFRCYPLIEDYQKFRDLFSQGKTACYILNTGYFNGKKVRPADTLGVIEQVVDESANFVSFGPLTGLSYLPIEAFTPRFNDENYLNQIRHSLQNRLNFIRTTNEKNDGYNALPDETISHLEQLIQCLPDE